VISLEGGDRDQAEVFHQEGHRDVEAGDRQVIAELYPGQADPAKDRQRREFPTVHP